MAGSSETPADRQRRDEALAAAASHAEAEAERPPRPLARAGRPDRPTVRVGADRAVVLGSAAGGHRRATVASASTVPINDRKAIAKLRSTRQAWQTEAWDYVGELPEVGNTLRYAANMMSKIRLYAAVRPDPGGEPVPVDDPDSGISPAVAEAAVGILDRLRSPQGGQTALIKALDWNLCEVSGECYLHGHDGDDGEEWHVRSVDELVVQEGRFALREALGARGKPLPDKDLVKRLWDPDPRFSSLATSPMRQAISTCETLLLLSRAMRSDAMSHLNSGFLVKAQELSFGSAVPTQGAEDGEEKADPFEENLNATLIDPIEDPGSAAAVAPGVITGPAQYITPDLLRHLSFTRPMDALLVQWIESLVTRLARGLNMPVEVTRGLQECVDEETEILTQDGWTSHDRLQPGDVVLTLDHETGLAEFQPVKRVARYRVEDQPLLSMERKSHSSLTTLNHRWPVIYADTRQRAWRTSETMTGRDRVVTAAPLVDLPTESKWTDDFVELIAWFYTEGHVDRRGHRDGGGTTVLTQSVEQNAANVDRIRAALTRLVGPARRRLNGTGPTWKNPARPQVEAWTESCDPNRPIARFRLSHPLTARLEAAAPDRVPTYEFLRSLTSAQLELFLEVSRLADGWTVNSGTRMFSQAERTRLDAYEFACILSGRTPSTWTSPYRGRRAEYRDKAQHVCSVTDRTTVAPLCGSTYKGGPVATIRPYTGVVWCPEVKNGTWLARRRGRVHFTGNTTFANAAQVTKSEWDAHGEPRAVLICDALTVGYYREALVEGGVDKATAADLFVWYDPAGAIRAPDPADYADKDHEDGLISDEARRRSHGWGEDAAPEDAELLRRLIYKGIIRDASLIAQLLRITGIAPTIKDPPSMGAALSARPLAAAARARPTGRDAGRRLAAIDRDLRTRVHVAAELAMRRLLERAGAKVRPKLGRTGPAAEAAAGVPNRELCARLGPGVVRTAAGDLGEVVDGAFDELVDEFGAWVDAAQAAARSELERLAGPLDAAALAEVEAAQRASAGLGRERLRELLADLAARRLYDPAPGAAAVGEGDAAATVPMGLVREALALAGGDKPSGGDGGPLTSPGGGPVGGVATGPDVLGRVGVEGFVWDYGSAPRTPFEPHLALDGVTFEFPDDPALANDEGWPDAPFYMPGDHDGCVCDAVPILLDPGDDEG